MTFFIKTYGCQMNERDSEAVAALLSRHGHVSAPDEAHAGVLIVNTCSVRGKAEAKALGKLGLLVAGKRDRQGRVVGVMGCMAQRLGNRIFDKVPGLDFAVGTRRLSRLPEILDIVAAGHGPVLEVDEGDGERFDELTGHADGRVSGFVNILLGCDRRCAYCIVPEVRGREWSRPAAGILEEVSRMASAGVREVTLLGQSVMSYGRRNAVWPADYRSPAGFEEPMARLLEAVGRVEGIRRVRFTSGHPSGCTDELARAASSIPQVCEHLHLPLQSGSDRILSRMRRGYTTAVYRDAVARFRAAVPGLAITTDIIVGFPGESAADFEMTRAFCGEIGFDNAFIFKYSPRPGTLAAEWMDDVCADEKQRRNKVLLNDQNARCLSLHGEMVGRTFEVLAEGVSRRNPRRWTGRTRTNRIVVFEPAAGLEPGAPVAVRVERAMAQSVYGRVVEVARE